MYGVTAFNLSGNVYNQNYVSTMADAKRALKLMASSSNGQVISGIVWKEDGKIVFRTKIGYNRSGVTFQESRKK